MKLDLKPQSNIFFFGIGGIGMSGLAKLALGLGHRVYGIDSSSNEYTQELEILGATLVGNDFKTDEKSICIFFNSYYK
jgi:UDP-N-acetylmuramate-alanine ligase